MKFERLREKLSRWNAGRQEKRDERIRRYNERIRRYEDAAEEHRGDPSYNSPYLRRRD